MRGGKFSFVPTLKNIRRCNKVYRNLVAQRLGFDNSEHLIKTFEKAILYTTKASVCITNANKKIKSNIDVPMSITFKRKDGTERFLIGHYFKINSLGCLLFRDYQDYRKDNIKEVNPKNIIDFTINGTFYWIK